MENWSLYKDIKIIFETFLKIIRENIKRKETNKY